MSATIRLCATLICVLLAYALVAEGQVTFSTDWLPRGKRPSQCDAWPVTGLCRVLMTEIQKLVLCEAKAAAHYIPAEDGDASSSSQVFSGGR